VRYKRCSQKGPPRSVDVTPNDLSSLQHALADAFPDQQVEVDLTPSTDTLYIRVGDTEVKTPDTLSARALSWPEWMHRIKEALHA
jgi:hypothetical protein